MKSPRWNLMQPLCGDAASKKIVLAAFIDRCLVDSVAFDDESQIPAMKQSLLDIYGPTAVVLRKTDHVPAK